MSVSTGGHFYAFFNLCDLLTRVNPRCRALDCILEPGKRVLEVGSGLGYWAHLLKLRCGDDSRVRCFDPFAPPPPPVRGSGVVKDRPTCGRRRGVTCMPLTGRRCCRYCSVARRRTSHRSSCFPHLPGSYAADGGSSGGAISAPSRDGTPSTSPPGIEWLTLEEAEEVDDWFGERRAPFTPAERGSFERIAQEDPHDKFRSWSLLICWPSDGQWPAGCLEAFEGEEFFYVGEGEGGATRMPWHVLREQWDLERRVAIPNWPGFKDALWWYRRKGAAPWPPNR